MEYNHDIQRLFMETLRFSALMVVHAKRLVRDDRWRMNPVMNTNELYFCIEGGFYLVIDENRYYIDKNKMVCIPANVYRDIYIEKGNTAEFYTMQFGFEAKGQSAFNYICPAIPVDITEYRSEAERLFGGMTKIGEPMSYTDVLRRIGFAGELLALYFEMTRPELKLPKHKSKIDFEKVITYIDAFYRREKISVAELAKLARVSEGYFRREFKKEYGVSCKEYINSRRLNGALKMLRESEESLKSIAKNFRYSDTAYLSRVIKKRTGLSPMEYRRRYIGNKQM